MCPLLFQDLTKRGNNKTQSCNTYDPTYTYIRIILRPYLIVSDRTIGQYRIISVRLFQTGIGQNRTVSDNIGPNWTISNKTGNIGPYQTISDHIAAILEHISRTLLVGPYRRKSVHIGTYLITPHNRKTFNIADNNGKYGTIPDQIDQ